MGVSQRKRLWALLLAGLHFSSLGADQVAMETVPWPSRRDCSQCLTLQFGVLEMHLPTALINKIFISGGEEKSLHLVPGGADIRHSLLLASTPSERLAGKYHALIPMTAEIADAERFLDRLGRPAPATDPWSKIRKVENLEAARRYTKSSRNSIHAYWIQPAPSDTHYLHFVVDGQARLYTIMGSLTPELYEAILSNLEFRSEP